MVCTINVVIWCFIGVIILCYNLYKRIRIDFGNTRRKVEINIFSLVCYDDGSGERDEYLY